MRRGSVRISNIPKWFFREREILGKSLSGAASELGLDLSLFCEFFSVDRVYFIRGYTALVSYL